MTFDKIRENLHFKISYNSKILQFRMGIFAIMVINLLMRIPRTPHLIGNDTFIAVFLAKTMNEGWYEVWKLNPLSIFGLYPYASYPIGSLFLLSFFLEIGSGIDMGVYLFSTFFMILSVFTSNKLSEVLFEKDARLKLFFIFIYTTSPIFVYFSYWTCTLRGPFLAILPLVIYYNIKLYFEPKIKTCCFFVLSFLALTQTHGLFFFYPFYFLSFILAIINSRLRILNQNKDNIIIPLIYIFLFYIGIPVVGFSLAELYFDIYNFSDLYNLFTITRKISLYYIEFIGLSCFLSIIGFLSFIKLKSNTRNKFLINFNIIILFFLFFFASRYDYTILFCIPVISFFSTHGLNFLLNLEKKRKEIIIYMCFFITQSYFLIRNYFIQSLSSFAFYVVVIFTIIILLFLIIQIFGKDQRKLLFFNLKIINFNSCYAILISSVIIFSLISNDIIYSSEFPYQYLSDEEITVSNYLKSHNKNNEIILVYHTLIARRIMALTMQPTFFPENPPSILYFGMITPEEIHSQIKFNIFNLFITGRPFTSPNYDLNIKYILNLNLDFEMEIALSLGIRYIIVNSKNPTYYISTRHSGKELILITVINNGLNVLETENLILYQLINQNHSIR